MIDKKNGGIKFANPAPKSKIDTKHDGFLKRISFQIWLFSVSMLIFGGLSLSAFWF